MAPCAVMQQGAGSVQDYRRSSIIPSVAKVGGQKTGKQNNSQNCHKNIHVT